MPRLSTMEAQDQRSGTGDSRRVTVSVVVPMKNEERYIGKCLETILANDFPMDQCEILVMDGRSTDRSRMIVEEKAAQYPMIRLLDNPGEIAPTAMNLGIRAARGQYILRMDGHSEYPSNYIRTCLEELERTGADNVGGRWITRPGSNSLVARAVALMTQHPLRAAGGPGGVGDNGEVVRSRHRNRRRCRRKRQRVEIDDRCRRGKNRAQACGCLAGRDCDTGPRVLDDETIALCRMRGVERHERAAGIKRPEHGRGVSRLIIQHDRDGPRAAIARWDNRRSNSARQPGQLAVTQPPSVIVDCRPIREVRRHGRKSIKDRAVDRGFRESLERHRRGAIGKIVEFCGRHLNPVSQRIRLAGLRVPNGLGKPPPQVFRPITWVSPAHDETPIRAS